MSINNQVKLIDLFQIYASECQYTKNLSLITIKNYKEVFSFFIQLMREITYPDDLHPHILNIFFERINTRKGEYLGNKSKSLIKTSTTRTYYNKLIVFFRWLENNNYISDKTLCDKIPKPPSPNYDDVRSLTKKEVSKIIGTIALQTLTNEFLNKRDLLIINIFLYTGIRKGELLGLRIQDVDFVHKTLFIKAETSKSKRSRTIPLNPIIVAQLKIYLSLRKRKKSTCNALLVSSLKDQAFTEHGLNHWVKKYSDLSDVKFHVHKFRHTFACNLAKSNADIISIMNAMGHKTIRMTENYLRSIKSEGSRTYIDKLVY